MLEHVNFDEARQSQLLFVELLVNMGYTYISKEDAIKERLGSTSNFILHDIAAQKLMEINSYEVAGVNYKFSEKEVRDCVDELEHIQYEGLIDTAQKIYNMIMPTSGGKTIKVNHIGKKVSKNFKFIDFENPYNNSFHVTAEFVASGKQNIRPDIVCFVNGIPFAVVENKKSSVSVQEALSQMNRNQGSEYCPKLFTYTQLLVGTNSKELQYGTTATLNKFFAVWKEKETENFEEKILGIMQKQIDYTVYKQILTDLNGDTRNTIQYTSRLVTEQDKGVVALFEPARLLDLAKNYIVFDAGIKKLSRYQQYFAIHKMLNRISEFEDNEKAQRRRGGLVWHTQGSGKSLTMVMFVKALIESPHIVNPRVIIVTDRKDLDKQIKDTFLNCNLKKEVIQATSGQHLIDMVQKKELAVITTLVHKFESARKKNSDLVDQDSNIFVLIDEAHRSQAGIANLEMNRIIPNACYIGFTGTPLMKEEKASWKKFGDYIDKYTIDDALEDEIVLPLIYEGRYVDLVQNEEQVDRRIERITSDLGDAQKKELQKYIGSQIIKNNPQRIAEIAYDIEKHFSENFKDTGLKAQIVAPSKFSAVLFQKYFEEKNSIRTGVVISDEHEDGDEANIHKKYITSYLDGVRHKNGSIEKHEKTIIESFKYHDDGIEIIIVVDKLLTGFDAPRNTVLYLAKDLKDHNLLQAIARVNRLYENKKEKPKTVGYIIDYSENAKNINTAMKLFGNYDEDDVKGTLIDVSEKIQELQTSYSSIHDLFKELSGSTDDEAYIRFLASEPRREMFYKLFNHFVKNMNECYVLQDFVREFKYLDVYKRELKKLLDLRKAVSLQYADRVDLSEYKQSLVNILDKYVDAKGVELLTKQINITDKKQFEDAIEKIGTDASKAEAIAAQTQKTIQERMESDPEFYERFSKKISKILEEMRLGKLADIEVLKQMKLIKDDVVNKKDESVPEVILKQKGADIFYRNLINELNLERDEYTEVVLQIVTIINQEAIVDWYKNITIKRQIANALDDYFYDVLRVQKGLNLSEEESKKIISHIMQLAENNYEIIG